ncbi:MAG: hypothetical protein HY223_06850 [Thaumarchaeota archaeon]|nr:hypothetical protein [Nitrososphaerota archaeon]
MHLSWQALFFGSVLLSSVSIIPLAFAQNATSHTMTSGINTVLNGTIESMASINKAIDNHAIVAQIDFKGPNIETKSLDDNVSISWRSIPEDGINISVDTTVETDPKVLLINLSSANVNVQELKNDGIIYDGWHMKSVQDIDSILHAKSTDKPSFAIIVNQSGAQILVLIPYFSPLFSTHFSQHSIFMRDLSIVTSPIPEFPVAIFQSPKKQTEQGLSADLVKCSDGLILIKKLSDNSPACVKPQTAQKLVERGWGENFNPSIPPQPQLNTVTLPPPSPVHTDRTLITIRGQTFATLDITTPNFNSPNRGNDTAVGFLMMDSNPLGEPPMYMMTVDYDFGDGTIGNAGTYLEHTYSSTRPGTFHGSAKVTQSGPVQGTLTDTINFTIIVLPTSAAPGPNPVASTQVLKIGQKIFEYSIKQIMPSSVEVQYYSCYPLCDNKTRTETIPVGKLFYTQQDCFTSTRHTFTLVSTNETTATFSILSIPSQGLIECPICLSADSMIKTPNGNVNVKDIRDGTIVWSTDSNGTMIKSNVIKINNVFVGDTHKVIDLQLADGRELFVSPNHPTYDNRIIADLKVGETYDGSTVKSIELVQYKYHFTYDILPDSQTGNYWANGILVGSTLK